MGSYCSLRSSRVRFLVQVGAATALVSCASAGALDPTEIHYAPELAIELDRMTRTSEGLYWAERGIGSGEEAVWNSRVVIHYRGWHPDGTLLESSLEEGGAVEFTLGEGEVIRGWELGIRGMKVGGRRILVIPPHLAYGSRGIPGAVPRNATLVFEVQLVDVQR